MVLAVAGLSLVLRVLSHQRNGRHGVLLTLTTDKRSFVIFALNHLNHLFRHEDLRREVSK